MSSRVKSLELQGYKTFASSTIFEFADTVTAIVGPNGSGKSNVVDALRWVLGEQSYSLLRGRKTEDMIFAGSEHRARAGMAAATLTFNNDTGWLPIDFSEVAISRRAYRDGQNEYVLNGQRVRLKDVSELLSKSGLAERTYTIIGQGLVDTALSLKAEERRRLFEEAAGIRLYRSRREEALRRLETTKRNIERVQDILTELRPHLKSLERQAEKASEYERAKTDLRVVLREWYGYQWHQAQGELIKARMITHDQELALKNARREQEVLDTKLQSLSKSISKLREKLGQWRREVVELQSKLEIVRREIAVSEERIRSFTEQHKNVKNELVRAGDELEQREIRLGKANENIDYLKIELATAQSNTTTAIENLQARQAARLKAELDLKGVRSNMAELAARNSYLDAMLLERSERVESKQKELKATRISIQDMEADFNKTKARLIENNQALGQLQSTKGKIEERIYHVQNEKTSLEESRNEITQRQGASINERERLSTQIDLIEAGENVLTGFAQGARKVLEVERFWRPGELQGILRKELGIPVEFEIAIAGALGDYLDVVLIEDDSRLDEILDVLNVERVRGALLPLNKFQSEQRKSILAGQDGIIGIAAKLISVPSHLRQAVDLLLGGVILVDDRVSAQRLLEKLSKERGTSLNSTSDLRVVTLDGEIYYLNGLVIGGKESRVTSIRIERKREENIGNLEIIRKNLERAIGELRDINDQLKKLGDEEKHLQDELEQSVQRHEKAREEKYPASLELERIAAKIQLREEQCDTFKSEIRNEERQITGIKEKISHIEELITQQQDFISQQEGELDEDLPLDELQAKATLWKTRLAVSERGVEDAEIRLKERLSIYERACEDHDALKSRLGDIHVSKSVVLEDNEDYIQKEKKVYEGLTKLQGLADQAERSLFEEEQEQQRILIREGEARQVLNLAEHQFAQAKIKLAQRQESMETLKRRIEDDFGLVAFEYSDGISGPKPLPMDGVEQLPIVEELSPDIADLLNLHRASLRRLGAINPEAQAEYNEIKERFQFLNDQIKDLQEAESDIRQVVSELDELMRREFEGTFNAVANEFSQIFKRLFGGGSARLVLTNPDDLTWTGIDIEARLPGRREQGLSLLSGGERSLAATSLVFALLKVSPTPFCVLDEVDAMLDDSNTGRFRELLYELSQNTQFVVITHNRNTVQVADVIYGVTMGRDSSSQVISLKMDQEVEMVG